MYNLIYEEIRIKRQIKFQRIIIKFDNIIGFRVKSKNCKSQGKWFHYNGTPSQIFLLKIPQILRGYSGGGFRSRQKQAQSYH